MNTSTGVGVVEQTCSLEGPRMWIFPSHTPDANNGHNSVLLLKFIADGLQWIFYGNRHEKILEAHSLKVRETYILRIQLNSCGAFQRIRHFTVEMVKEY
ncbi:hypothetical protein ABEB36_001482 [Hypothenemus hampei]|uniref:Uncharacterized protein n=1 Tax=Hypothenemus hampei TaxID=57062 RepID=A0ABD1FEP5_HYPHA